MSSFGHNSQLVVDTLHPILQEGLNEAIKSDYFDFSVVDGYRSDGVQNMLFTAGKSKAKAGESAHNYLPSFGVDIIPHPSGYTDGQAMLLLAGHIIGTFERLGYDITNGSDWDRDGMVIDTSFKDFWHFEIMSWRTMV